MTTNDTDTRPRCDVEIPFQDFDGSRNSMPCGQPATWRIEGHDEQGEYYVLSEVAALGGWDNYRQACIESYGLGIEYGEDPGEEPDEGHYGDFVIHLCSEHYNESQANNTWPYGDDTTTIYKEEELVAH